MIATFTPNPPWWLTLPWVALGLVVLALGCPVNPGFFPVLLVIVMLVFGGTALASWLWRPSQRTRVAERPLIVGIHRQVIPFATIDPGRVAISSRVRYLGVHFHPGGMRTLQSQGPTAVINGLNPKPGVSNPYSPASSVPSPFCEWGLSCEPVALLSALESAMVAAGFPAHGMTERARAHSFAPPRKHPARDLLVIRRALDPPIGVSGPLRH